MKSLTTTILFIFIIASSIQALEYPNILIHISVSDISTNKNIEDAYCYLIIDYETKKCLPDLVEAIEEYSDTFIFHSTKEKLHWTLLYPPKKYSIKIKHTEYKHFYYSTSFNDCYFSTVIHGELHQKDSSNFFFSSYFDSLGVC